jgi:hypothetical protein
VTSRRISGSTGLGRKARTPSTHRAQLCQPEVEQLRAARGQHDVAGLQIAVDDPVAVCLVEGVGDFDGVAERPIERECTIHQPLSERLAFQILHHQ